jgi:hypothetical protein
LLIGIVWVHKDASIAQSALTVRDGSVFLNEVDVFQQIVLGGERNYGFGRLRRIPIPRQLETVLMNLWPANPKKVYIDEYCCLPAHLPYRNDLIFKGEIEILAGREYPHNIHSSGFDGAGKSITNAGYFFAPGTRLHGDGMAMRMDCIGRFVWPRQ